MNNGSDDEARNAILVLHGIPTSANSVIIPAAQKHYLVHSTYTSVSGGITVKTATGTGHNFSTDQTGLIYCDGVSVYQIAGVASALDPSNNLSDVASAQSARENLGLEPQGPLFTSGAAIDFSHNAPLEISGSALGLNVSTPLKVSGSALQIDTATTASAGVIELATSAEVSAGTDTTKAVTPGTLGASFTEDLTGTDGFTFFPNSLGLQWGVYGGAASTGAVTFTTAFPASCFGVEITETQSNRHTHVATTSVGGFSFETRQNVTNSLIAGTFFWLAIGK